VAKAVRFYEEYVIKKLICQIVGCECGNNSLEDFIVDVDTYKKIFTLPEFYCTNCCHRLDFILLEETVIPEINNTVEMPNAG
jgi:hypothetical protein